MEVPIIFEYAGKTYRGVLSEVSGMGANVWHLMINRYYRGSLVFGDRIFYYGNSFEEIGDFFADYLIAWLE